MVHHKQTTFYQDGSVKKGVQSCSLKKKKNAFITKQNLSMLVPKKKKKKITDNIIIVFFFFFRHEYQRGEGTLRVHTGVLLST